MSERLVLDLAHSLPAHADALADLPEAHGAVAHEPEPKVENLLFPRRERVQKAAYALDLVVTDDRLVLGFVDAARDAIAFL